MELSEPKRLKEDNIPENIRLKVSSFPSMPQAAVKLRNLFKKDDVPIDEIENILRQDPGFSANILRLANSAHFGLSSKVGSLKQAVMLLGLKRFEQIAISAYMNNTMDKPVEGYDLPPGILWLHSIAVATTAEALAKFFKIDYSYDVFTPALLHDMGKLILGKFVKEESKQIESIVERGESLVRAEHMVLGTDHAEIGALILQNWSFPNDIVDAVRWHHDPEYISTTYKRLKNPSIQSDIVYISNLIFQSIGGSDSVDGKLSMPPSEVLNRLRINLDQYKALAEKALIWLHKLSENLSFEQNTFY
jgi:putative nucleotidyltransferase with HDIG domain